VGKKAEKQELHVISAAYTHCIFLVAQITHLDSTTCETNIGCAMGVVTLVFRIMNPRLLHNSELKHCCLWRKTRGKHEVHEGTQRKGVSGKQAFIGNILSLLPLVPLVFTPEVIEPARKSAPNIESGTLIATLKPAESNRGPVYEVRPRPSGSRRDQDCSRSGNARRDTVR
jgi:hypothetical protein